MTWGTDTKITPGTIVTHDGPAPSSPDPGKSTRTQGPQYTTNPYVDGGAACEQPGAAGNNGCFLPAPVRKRLIESSLIPKFHAVNEVFQRACDMIRVEWMIKQDVPIPAVAGMILDLIGVKFGLVLGGNLLKIREAAIMSARNMEIHNPDGIASISTVALTAMVSSGVGIAKARVVKALEQSMGEQKASAKAFLLEIKRHAAVGFEMASEQLSAFALDGELITADEAMSPQYHDQGDYEQLIRDKVDRYLATITQIGRSQVPAGVANNPQGWVDGKNPHYVDVRCSWAKFLSGYPRRLMFEHASHFSTADESGTFHNADADRPMEPGLPNPELRPSGDQPGKLHFVDFDLVEVAIQRHKAAWGTDPIEVPIDDSGWYWDPPRAAAALAKKASPTPRLQLGGDKTQPNKAPSPANDGPSASDVAQGAAHQSAVDALSVVNPMLGGLLK